MNRFTAFVSLVLLAVIFFGANLAAGLYLRNARIDFTEHRLYSLNQGSKNILAALESPIALKFYYSQRLANDYPTIRLYGERVRDLLQEMRAHARGKISFQLIDPAPFSPQEDEALARGLVARPIEEGEVIYFGLVGNNARGAVETIAYFADEREQYLEYDLARLIDNLAREEKPTLGILSNLPLDTGAGGVVAALRGESQPFLIYHELIDRYELEFLTGDVARVPNSIDALLLAHPRPLTPRQTYAVDQYLMRGGRLLAFLDPQSEVSLTAGPDGAPLRGATAQSNLAPLMNGWGVSMADDKIIADRARAQKVAVGQDARRLTADYILWLGLTREDFAQESVVLAGVNHLNIGTAGALQFQPRDNITYEPLVFSSADSSLMARDFVLELPAPDALLSRFQADDTRHIIAARLQGDFTSAFSAPPKAALKEASISQADHKNKSTGGEIILFADSDFFDDRFWVSEQIYQGQRFGVPIADNAKFLLNALDYMLGTPDLISLRAREKISRPFTRVEALRAKAETQYRTQQDALLARIDKASRELDALTSQDVSLQESEAAARAYRAELVAARRALRDVQAQFNREIDALGARLFWLNILTMPSLIALLGFALAFSRARKQRKTRQNHQTQ